MKLKFYFLTISVLFTTITFAQTDFKPGYYVSNTNDTIFGEIDYRSDEIMSTVCKFRKNSDSKVTEFLPSEINSFRFLNSKYYVSKVYGGKYSFFEYLVNGKLNLYYLHDAYGNHYYLENNSISLTELEYKDEIKNIDGKQYFHTSTKHFGILTYFMKDAPEFESRIKQIQRLEHKNLIKLVEDYNNRTCGEKSCSVYVKKLPSLQVNVELAGVMSNYPYYDSSKRYFDYGLLAHLWIPSVNEKLFFKTGIIRTELMINRLNYDFVKIPLQLEYVYPKGVVRPVFAMGVNALFPVFSDFTLALTGGANINVSRTIAFSLNYNIDFEHKEYLPFIPQKLFSHTIYAGLIVKL